MSAVSFATLEKLPTDHPLRNAPLADIKAQNRWKNGGPWKTVGPNWAIARCTFNDLGPAWTDHATWRADPSAK